MRRFVAVAVGAGLAVTIGPVARAAAPGAAAGPCGHPGRVVAHDRWIAVRPPPFAAGPPNVSGYAVDPVAPQRVYVTNGTAVQRSDDGGCEWVNAFQAPSPPAIVGSGIGNLPPGAAPVTGTEIVGVVVADSFATARPAYLVEAEHHGSAGDRPVVLVSPDGGAAFQPLAGAGLPAVGTPRRLAASGVDPQHLAMAIGGGGVAVSRNGGAAWVGATGIGPVDATGVAFDPIDPTNVWAWGRGLFHSTDGGSSFARLAGIGPVAAVDVAHPSAQPSSRVAVFLADTGDMRVSTDGGRRFSAPVAAPAGVQSAAHGNAVDDLFVATGSELRAYSSSGSTFVAITPDDASSFLDVTASRGAKPDLFVRTPFGFERSAVSSLAAGAVSGASARVAPAKLSPPHPSTFTPDGLEIPVAPGGTATTNERIDLARQNLPIDVWFLSDTTQTMDAFLSGLQLGIRDVAAALVAAKVDARFGLGEFRDYPLQPYGGGGDFPYQRDRDLGPYDQQLRDAVANMSASGGNDDPESQLAALYQSATAAGQAPWVGRGEGATFRADALKVIVLGTDSVFHQADPTYPGPSFDTTVAALTSRGIKVVGLTLGNRQSRPDLERVAGATGAVASDAIDCDGDGRRDLQPGDPLVCPLSERVDNIAAAVVGLLSSVGRPGTATVSVTGPAGVVRGVSRAQFAGVNLGADQQLPFSVTYGCGRDQAGQRFAVTLTAAVDGRPVATGRATVVCGALTVPARPLEPTANPPIAPGPVAPAPPPAPVPLVQPAPQVQGQVANQAQLQGQTGLAAQEQERPQVALAGGGPPGGAGADQHAFTDLRHRPLSVPPGFTLAAGILLAAAAGVGLRHRPSHRPASIRSRSS